ncbi:MAG: RNA polymerase sigma-70 factor [Prevotella sp.]|nr:RNA polymerase sigma-70 factor [Prevotella sp.]
MEGIDLSVVKRWDNQSVAMLYKAYYKALYSYARQMTGDEEPAKDIVQEVFFNTWKRQGIFESETALRTYLYNATRNESINYIKCLRLENDRKKLFGKRLKEMQMDENGDLTLHKEEVYRLMFEAIDALPPKQREIFLLLMKGKKNSEIAEAMNISINTVKTQRQSGMDKLRNRLSPDAFLLLLLLMSS